MTTVTKLLTKVSFSYFGWYQYFNCYKGYYQSFVAEVQELKIISKDEAAPAVEKSSTLRHMRSLRHSYQRQQKGACEPVCIVCG